MKRSTLSFVFAVIVFAFSNGQDSVEYCSWHSRLLNLDMSYDLLQRQANEYIYLLPDSIFPKERKYFNRADYFLSSRVGGGDSAKALSITRYNRAVRDFIINWNLCPGNNNNANWQYTGPYLNTHNIGIVTAVWSDLKIQLENHSTIILGCH